MAIIKGRLFIGKRKYKYYTQTFDVGETTEARFVVQITNPVGDARKTYWNFRKESIEQAVLKYIMEQKRKFT